MNLFSGVKFVRELIFLKYSFTFHNWRMRKRLWFVFWESRRVFSVVFGKVVACLTARSTASCFGRSTWPEIQMNLIWVQIKFRGSRIRWMSEFVVKWSKQEWGEETESMRRTDLPYGGSCEGWERQENFVFAWVSSECRRYIADAVRNYGTIYTISVSRFVFRLIHLWEAWDIRLISPSCFGCNWCH